MLWTIVVILLLLWLLGVITNVTVSGMAWLIHLLLVAAIIAVLYRVIVGRKALGNG